LKTGKLDDSIIGALALELISLDDY